MAKQHKIYCEGCYCKPMQVINERGETEWRWVVVTFSDDCTENGEEIDINVKSKTEAGLVNEAGCDSGGEVEQIVRNSKSMKDLYKGIPGLDPDMDEEDY